MQSLKLRSLFQKTHVGLWMLYAAVLPVHWKLSIKLMWLVLIASIFCFSWSEIKSHLIEFKWIIFFFIGLLTSALLSTELGMGLKAVENRLIILAVLFASVGIGTDFKKIQKIFLAFVVGCVVASASCLGYAVYRDYTEGAYWAYNSINFTDFIDSHHVYLAYYLNLSLLGIAVLCLQVKNSLWARHKLVSALVVLFLLVIEFFLAARTPVAALLSCVAIYIISFRKDHNLTLQKFVIGGVASFVLFIAVVFFASNSSRAIFFQRFASLYDFAQQSQHGGLFERIKMWQAAVNPSNFLLGTGIGDADIEYNTALRKKGLTDLANDNYNPHNQFLAVYFSQGAVGLSILLVLMTKPFVRMWKTRSAYSWLFFLPFFLYGISEVFLGRYQGLAIYFCLYTLFPYNRIVSSWHLTSDSQ